MASCVALVSVMGAMPCSAPTSFIRGARQTPGPRHAAAERRSGGVRARKAAVRRCVAADGKGGDVSASVWSSTVNDDVDSDNTNREEGLRSVAGRRQTMAASIAVSVGVFGALGARSAWAASEPVDPATSPLVQELLRRTEEKKEARVMERLDDYNRRNFKDYFDVVDKGYNGKEITENDMVGS